MLLALVATAALTASPSTGIRLAAPGFAYVDLDPAKGDFFVDYFAQQLSAKGGFRVTTKQEVSSLLGFERQKQLLGCSDSSTTCLAELAGALGAEAVVTGSLGRAGKSYIVNVKVVAAVDGRELGAQGGRVNDEEALLDWFVQAAGALAPGIHAGLRPPSAEGSSGARGKAWIPAGIGVLLVGAGIFEQVSVGQIARELAPENDLPLEVRRTKADAGKAAQTYGALAFAGAGVSLAVAGALYAFGAPEQARVSMAPSGTGLMVGFGGRFP